MMRWELVRAAMLRPEARKMTCYRVMSQCAMQNRRLAVTCAQPVDWQTGLVGGS